MIASTKLKEAVSIWVKNILNATEKYKNTPVGGAFSKKKTYPHIAVIVIKENPITNAANGMIGYDNITGDTAILYVSDFTIGIEVLAEIDEESVGIAEIIVDKIRDGVYIPISDDIDIQKVYDEINISEATVKKMGDFKVFSSIVSVDIRVKNIKIKQGD
mgnify:CR=1 FL=1